MTSQIIFIRHAEKPADKHNNHLSHKGSQRAELLADYLLYPLTREIHVPRNAFVMTMGSHHKTVRCEETMMPTLAQAGDKLHCELVHRSGGTNLPHRLLRLAPGSHTIVCWEHSRIIDMLNIMGVSVLSWGLDPDASRDDKHCFDATWVCDVTSKTIRLRVYRQFDVIDGEASYNRDHTYYDRNHVWFDHTYPREQAFTSSSNCVVM